MKAGPGMQTCLTPGVTGQDFDFGYCGCLGIRIWHVLSTGV